MSLKWNENWDRSYRITIGTREVIKDDYYYNIPTVLQRTEKQKVADDVTVPSNARVISNLIEDKSLPRGFTFRFDSVQGVSSNSSDSERTTLILYNLNQDLIDVVSQDKCIIIVEAGYQGKVELVYTGDVVRLDTYREGADKVYKLSCTSGGVSFRNTLVNISYDESLSERDVIIDMVGRFPGTAIGTYGLGQLSDRYKTGGRTFVGSLVTNFDKVMAKNNLSYAHINGKIVIIPFKLREDDATKFSRTNFNIPANTIKRIDNAADKSGISTSSEKSKISKVSCNTFFIPIEVGQVFTIPSDVDELKRFAGSYLTTKRRVILESKGSAWDVVLEGDSV